MGQVRRVFAFLAQSDRRAHDPKALVESCRSLNLSNPVNQQNDARDVLDKLVDRLEIALKARGRDLRECFGGKIVHQNIKQGCPHPATERFEDFIALEVQIKVRGSCAGGVGADIGRLVGCRASPTWRRACGTTARARCWTGRTR
jgi:hypothetical protein